MLWSSVTPGPVADWAHQGVQAWFRWRPQPVGSHSVPFTYSFHSLPRGHDTSAALICQFIIFRGFLFNVYACFIHFRLFSLLTWSGFEKSLQKTATSSGLSPVSSKDGHMGQYVFATLVIFVAYNKKSQFVHWQSPHVAFAVSWWQQEAAPLFGRFSESAWTREELQFSNVRRNSQVSQYLYANSHL